MIALLSQRSSLAAAEDRIQTIQLGVTSVVVITVIVAFLRSMTCGKGQGKSKCCCCLKWTKIDGKTREEITAIAIKERRQKRPRVFLPPSDLQKAQSEQTYPKTEDEKALIASAVRGNFVFSSLDPVDTEALVEVMQQESVSSGTDIIVQGDPADFFYVIQEGEFSVFTDGKLVHTFTKGESFGEAGLLYNSPRNATVRAEEDSVVWKLDGDTFRRMLARAHTNYSTSVVEFLRSAPILRGLSQENMNKLTEVAVEVHYKRGQTIIKKGEQGLLGYFIIEGTIRVTDLPNKIPDMIFGPGEHFGLQALLSNGTRNATVVADSDVRVAALSADDIGEILGSLREIFLRDHEVRRLKSIPLFSSFENDQLASILENAQLKEFKEGDYIIRQGQVSESFFVIDQGECSIVHDDCDGKSTVLERVGTLGYFGEDALLNKEPSAAHVIAASDCKVFEVNLSTFEHLFGSSTAFSRHLTDSITGRKQALLKLQSLVDKIKMSQLDTLGKLGQGAFGSVSLVRDQKSKLCFALKEISTGFVEKNQLQRNIVREKEIMLQLDHPFILKLFATFHDHRRVYFLLEYCPGGELFDVVHNQHGDHGVPEHQAKFYAGCEVLALAHLELRSIAYRDLKPENTLIDADGYCRMIDMGFAKVITGKSYTFCGTPEYLAPELILGLGHNRAVDMFALGILIYEMICGQTPFYDYNTDEIMKNILRGQFRCGPKIDGPVKDLIQRLITVDPSKRLGMQKGGMADVMKHPWFADINFVDLVQKKIKAPWIPEVRDRMGASCSMKLERNALVSTCPRIDEDTQEWLENF